MLGPDRQLELADLLRSNGLKYPRTTIEEAANVGLPLSYALAFLQKETSGADIDGTPRFGLNLFGSTNAENPARGGFVNHSRYQQYLAARRTGLGMQGVGPMQLTWYGLQDLADRCGGCWHPRFNVRVGFAQAKALIAQYGRESGATRFNGTDAGAEEYGRDWGTKQLAWYRFLIDNETRP